eukprot:2776022-Rhodomonas_salina.1
MARGMGDRRRMRGKVWRREKEEEHCRRAGLTGQECRTWNRRRQDGKEFPKPPEGDATWVNLPALTLCALCRAEDTCSVEFGKHLAIRRYSVCSQILASKLLPTPLPARGQTVTPTSWCRQRDPRIWLVTPGTHVSDLLDYTPHTSERLQDMDKRTRIHEAQDWKRGFMEQERQGGYMCPMSKAGRLKAIF